MRLRRLVTLLAAGLALATAACGRPDLEDFANEGPELELERFLDGKLVAHGVFQDVLGNVRRTFVVDIQGNWDGERLTLEEDFVYEDGSTERRVWTLTKTGEETWEGSADGVIGTATGEESGSAFNWRYTIDLPTPDGPERLSFDDWIFKIDESVVINRAYVSKWGVTVGEVLISFTRETPVGG